MSTKQKGKKFEGFSDFERAAMKERAQELMTDKKDGESLLLAKLAEMAESDRTMGKRIHEIIMENASSLSPKTWYGMPAYANKEGKVVCFFQGAEKFKARYATLGFSDVANLDNGEMWPTSFALRKLTPAVEKEIIELVRRAVS